MKRLPAGLWGLAAALVLLASAACSARPSATDHPSTSTPSPSAAAPSGATPSGTPEPLSPGLQKILDDVASVRELDAPPALEVHLIARSDLPALLDSLLTDQDREWFHNTTTLYRLLGHFRDDQDYESVYQSFGSESVLGLYSPLDDALWVVHNDGEQLDLNNLPSEHRVTLAHELVHALQDYHFNLDEVYSRTVDDLDWGLTYTSAVEGDAVVSERAYTKKYGFRIGAGPVLFAAGGAAQAIDVPPSIARELLFPYTTGVDWVAEIKQTLGLSKVNEIVQDPPRGSTYVLHPELLAQGFTPADVTLPDISTALGSGWQRESGGQFGEFQIRNYLQLRIRAGQSASAAEGWQGDHYDVYANGEGSVATFRLQFADETEAQEFVEAHQDWLAAAGGEAQGALGYTFWETDDGRTTASAGAAGGSVTFVVASSREIAQTAINAIVHG